MKQENRGRKKVDNAKALETALAKPEMREVLLDQLQKLARTKAGIATKQQLYKDDVKSVAEAYGLTSGFVGTIVTSIVTGDINEKIGVLTNTVDLLQVVQDGLAE